MEQGIIQENKKASLFGMIWSPGEQFGRIRQNPKILVPLLLVTVLYFVGAIPTALSFSLDSIAGIEELTEEQAEIALMVAKTVMIAGSLIIPVLAALFNTVIHLIITSIAKKKVTFKQLFSMNIYIFFIGTLGFLLNALIQQLTGTSSDVLITSLAGVLNSESPILASFEVFTIWQLVLTAIGLNKVGQLSKNASLIIVIIFFLISLGLAAVGALLPS